MELSAADRRVESGAGAGVRLLGGPEALRDGLRSPPCKLAEYCQEAGVPEGVLNVVTGYGQTAGDALARHMDVDKISFTGSIRTARRLLQASGESQPEAA